MFAPPFLAERADGATGLLLAVGLFTIVIAAGGPQMSGATLEPAFFYGARRAS
jgi:hypothetical protein